MTQPLDLDALQALAEERDSVGAQLANVAFNWSQKMGYALTSDDCEMLNRLRREWDAATNIIPALFDRLRKAEALADEASSKALDLANKYDSIVQAITDPENQPSQYGTVPLAWLRKAEAAREANRDLRLAYIGIHVWLVVMTVRCVIDESKGLRALGAWLTSARGMNRHLFVSHYYEHLAQMEQARQNEYRRNRSE